MAVTPEDVLAGVPTVLLPGTGSDDVYLRQAFGLPLAATGARLVAVRPEPAGVVAGYLRALDEAAAAGPVAVGGVSLGAAVATAWAIENPGRVRAVLAALPPWTGEPGRAPAALSALHTAAGLRRDGLAAAAAAMTSTSPAWLAAELSRSWRRQWPELPDALEQAGRYRAPSADELGGLSVPLAVAAAPDDPIHPLAVAREWVAAAPRAALVTIGLEEFGPRPALLGAACLRALGGLS
jgi:pimeloyl-ACP methyl ester carboxylesterase